MKKAIVLIFVANLPVFGWSQIQSNQPGISNSNVTVDPKDIHWETAVFVQQIDSNTNVLQSTNTFRFGLFEHLELFAWFNHARYKSSNLERNGIDAPALGYLAQFTEKNARFQLGLNHSFSFPISYGKLSKSNGILNQMNIIWSQQVHPKWQLGGNVVLVNQMTSNPNFQYRFTGNVYYAPSEKWGTFVEYIFQGRLNDGTNAIDGGFYWYPAKRVQLDVYGGATIIDGNSYLFGSLGCSWRLFDSSKE